MWINGSRRRAFRPFRKDKSVKREYQDMRGPTKLTKRAAVEKGAPMSAAAGSDAGGPRVLGIPMKWLSLVLLVAQTTSLVTTIRYSVTVAGPRYYATTAVFWMEVIKLVAALLVVLYLKGGSG